MRVLSIRQPYAWFIVHAGKGVENRSWSTSFRGPVLIHASASMTRREYELGLLTAREATGEDWLWKTPPPSGLPKGGIVGVTEVLDCRPSPSGWRAGDRELLPWESPAGYALVLGESAPLPFVPCRGRLGLWDAEPDVLAATGLPLIAHGKAHDPVASPWNLERRRSLAPALCAVDERCVGGSGSGWHEYRLTAFGERVASSMRSRDL